MFGGLNRLLATAFAAGAVLTVVFGVAPAAFACNGGTSAVNVYKECLPSGSGGKSPTHRHSAPKRSHSGGPGSAGSTTNSTTPATSGPSSKALRHARKALRHARREDRRALAYVESTSPSRLVQSNPVSAAATPSAVGSAFDLGSGPTALLIVLAGTAVLLLAVSAVRGLRRRHR